MEVKIIKSDFLSEIAQTLRIQNSKLFKIPSGNENYVIQYDSPNIGQFVSKYAGTKISLFLQREKF